MREQDKLGKYWDRDVAKKRTQQINKLQRKHANTKRERVNHGCGIYGVRFRDKDTGELVANYRLN